MNKTAISWTDYSTNPIKARRKDTGKKGWFCVRVSDGCKNCYSATLNRRWGTGLDYTLTNLDQVEFYIDEKELRSWDKIPVGSKVFPFDMTDLFGEWVTDAMLDRVFTEMEAHDDLVFQLLTKRVRRMRDYLTARWANRQPPAHIWCGASIENQKAANERIPLLCQVPAAKLFLSVEPLLGYIDLARGLKPEDDDWEEVNALEDVNEIYEPEEFIEECEAECDWVNFGNDLVTNPAYVEHQQWRKQRAQLFALERQIDWVIIGGESGPGFREMEPEWAKYIVSQIKDDIPIWYKQGSGMKPGMNPTLDGVEWHQWPEER